MNIRAKIILAATLCLIVAFGTGAAIVITRGNTPETKLESQESETRENSVVSVEAIEGNSDAASSGTDSQILGKIVCFGDSLTFGEGAEEFDYPQVLSALTGLTTSNFGISEEDSTEITARALDTYTGLSQMPSIDLASHILVIEMGSNGGWDDYDELLSQYHEIIDASMTERYIILGDTDDLYYSTPTIILDEEYDYEDGLDTSIWEDVLEEEFGEHFFNLRMYLVNYGFSDMKITPSEEDLFDMSNGIIPESIRYDETHLTDTGYQMMALGIYKKGIELGYWK